MAALKPSRTVVACREHYLSHQRHRVEAIIGGVAYLIETDVIEIPRSVWESCVESTDREWSVADQGGGAVQVLHHVF